MNVSNEQEVLNNFKKILMEKTIFITDRDLYNLKNTHPKVAETNPLEVLDFSFLKGVPYNQHNQIVSENKAKEERNQAFCEASKTAGDTDDYNQKDIANYEDPFNINYSLSGKGFFIPLYVIAKNYFLCYNENFDSLRKGGENNNELKEKQQQFLSFYENVINGLYNDIIYDLKFRIEWEEKNKENCKTLLKILNNKEGRLQFKNILISIVEENYKDKPDFEKILKSLKVFEETQRDSQLQNNFINILKKQKKATHHYSSAAGTTVQDL